MSKIKDLSGLKFGKLTVMERIGTKRYGKDGQASPQWRCVCDCGEEVITDSRLLLRGAIVSCGCGKCTHKKSKTLLYKTWLNMKQRCSNKKIVTYKHYLDKGIKVCEEWENSFENFESWALSNGYKEGLTIDRINNDGDYEPSNCRWITLSEQQRNKDKRKPNIFVDVDGKKYSLLELSKEKNVPYQTLYYRFRRGKKLLKENGE